jgi:hypothetical protein
MIRLGNPKGTKSMTDSARGYGRGVVECFDADDIRAYARRGKLGRYATAGSLRSFEHLGHHGVWAPRDTLIAAGIEPYDVIDAGENLWTTVGWTRLFNLLTNQGSTQAFDATHTRVGVGDGTTAAAVGDTDLSAVAGSTHRYFNLVDAASTVSGATNKWTSTFATGNGNFAWNEWGVDQGTAGGTTVTAPFFNRAVPSGGIGTKTSASAWAFAVTLSGA